MIIPLAGEAVDDPECDQGARRPGEATERRAGTKDRHRGNPYPPRAKSLREPAGQWYDHRKREQIARRYPLDGVERRVELVGKRLERDVDNRRVEDRHDHAHHDDRGDEPDLATKPLPGGSWVPAEGRHS
jgi:hypothetical protein